MRKRSEVQLLIVDDEEGILEVLQANFELDGFKVLCATGGNDAFDLIKNNTIDFIISDIRMPNGDGISLLKNVKAHYPESPKIVMVSGFAEISAAEVKNLGGIDLITKPADIDALVDLVKLHCNCQ